MEEAQAAGMWPSLREWWKMYSTAGPMKGQHSLMTSGLISSGPESLLVGRKARALVILSGVRIVAGFRGLPSRALRIEGGESGNSVEARVERVSDGVVVISPSEGAESFLGSICQSFSEAGSYRSRAYR